MSRLNTVATVERLIKTQLLKIVSNESHLLIYPPIDTFSKLWTHAEEYLALQVTSTTCTPLMPEHEQEVSWVTQCHMAFKAALLPQSLHAHCNK